jgi:carboxyl-terminal processing protease
MTSRSPTPASAWNSFPSRSAAVAALSLLVAAPARAQSAYEQLQTFSGLLNQIRLNYVDSVTTQKLVRGAIDGMLSSLDPHSFFMGRDDALRMDAWRSGRLAATGISVEDVDGAITVQSVYPRSPAARAGVAPGDRILTLDDSTVTGKTAAAVQVRLLGERGSRVRLLLERGPRMDPETVSVRIRNEDIRPQSVRVSRTLGQYGVGYVRLEEFMPSSADEVRQAIDRVTRMLPRRLILDLRGNPGGGVTGAVDIASLFLPKDTLVFRSRGRRRDVDHEFRTGRDGPFRDMQLVLLIDEHSASAAEALTGSLQDHDRALVLGRRSFGKALMQQIFEVPPNGDAVWLTVGYILTPSGRLIQRRYRGLSEAQYYALAGRGGVAEDTTAVFHTDAGRIVRGGGGIRPDSVLPSAPPMPVWWIAAADSGFLTAVADSVAQTLAADNASREAWFNAPATWRERLLPPVLARAHARLGIRNDPDSAVSAHMSRTLAARVAEVRWGTDADDDLRLRSDPDVAAAIALFPMLPRMLRR